MNRIIFILLVFEAFAGCYHSGSHQQDGWDTEVDFAEAVLDLAQDEPDLEPELPPAPICGNGIVEDGEECDDGDENSDTEPDACRSDCMPARCGDEVADSEEDCDGTDMMGMTCASLTGYAGELSCSVICQFDTSECQCGNDICETGEDETICPHDCFGDCGNGVCEHIEDQFGCPADCGAIAISTAENHTCAVISDGSARCWGGNESGQLGDGTYINSNVPVRVTDLLDAVDVSAEGWMSCSNWGPCSFVGHTCAMLSDGSGRCWGCNGYGQLGNGTNTESNIPVAVTGLTEVVDITVGGGYIGCTDGTCHTASSCAELFDGSARCWGCNNYGQLGNGTNTNSYVPVAVTGLTGVVDISAGGNQACAVLSGGTAKCWGNNQNGQLGNGTNTLSNVPVVVMGLMGAVAVASGESHTCAILSDGTIRCWGANSVGQLGDGTNMDSNVPVAVMGLTDALAISAGGHTCTVLSDGTAKCWGMNGSGQLGDGTDTNSLVPVTVLGLTRTVDISVGGFHACALLSDGTAWCWGDNEYGQLGDGISDHPDCDADHDCSPVPVPVAPW